MKEGQPKKVILKERDIAFPDDMTVEAQIVVRGDARNRSFIIDGTEYELPSNKRAVVIATPTGEIDVIPWHPSMSVGKSEISVRDINRLGPEALESKIKSSLRRSPPSPKK